MPSKPRVVQPWSSPQAAHRQLVHVLGLLETESYLSVVRGTVVAYELAVRSNGVRRYRESISAAKAALRVLDEARRRFGFDEDASEIKVAASQVERVEARHRERTDPSPVRDTEGKVRYQLPSQLAPFMGHGRWLDEENRATLTGLAATFGAARWFERCKSEGCEPRSELGPALLFITAIAVSIEPPSAEAYSKDGAIDKAQRRWGKRLKLTQGGGKSSLATVTGGGWQHLSEADQRAVRAEVKRLRSVGRPVEARERELFLGMKSDGGNRKAR